MAEQFYEPHRPRTTIVAILFAVMLLASGSALQGTSVSLRGSIEGFSEQTIGIIMSAYFIGFILGSLVSAKLIHLFGYVRTFAAFASLASIMSLAHILFIYPLAWILFRACQGLFLSGMLVVIESWLNISASSFNRGRIIGLYSLVYLASMGIGQPLIGLFSPAQFEIFAIASIFISFSLVPLALTKVTGSPPITRVSFKPIQAFKRSSTAACGVILSGMSIEAMWSLAPLFGHTTGFSEQRIGTFMLTLSLGALASQWPLGWISDRTDRRKVIFTGSCISALAAVGIALLASFGSLIFVPVFLFGAFGMPLYSLSIALMNDQLDTSEMVQAASALVILYGLGAALGPYCAGILMNVLGPSSLFIFISFVLSIFALFSLYRITAGPFLRNRFKENYHPYPRTTYAAFNILRKGTHSIKRSKKVETNVD